MPPRVARSETGAPVQIVNGRNFRRALRATMADLPRVLNRALKDVVDRHLVRPARERATARGTPVQRKAAPSIRAMSSGRAAKIAVGGQQRYPFAVGAFMGAKQFRQFDAWVGNSWQPGGDGGPYIINAAIRDNLDDLEEAVDEVITNAETLRAAFPIQLGD